MSLLKEFKEFAMKGNVLDMAVGVILGAAFGKIISCLVNDVLMPPIGQLLGGVNFSDLFVLLDKSKGEFTSLAKAREAGKLRIEGKEYVVQDGDVVEFRFNV